MICCAARGVWLDAAYILSGTIDMLVFFSFFVVFGARFRLLGFVRMPHLGLRLSRIYALSIHFRRFFMLAFVSCASLPSLSLSVLFFA